LEMARDFHRIDSIASPTQRSGPNENTVWLHVAVEAFGRLLLEFIGEVGALIDAARKRGRHGHRDATAILITYRHGLRASELCELAWDMIELDQGRIHVRRAKHGVDSTHPLTGKEIRALRQLRRDNHHSRYVFNTERNGPVTRAWFFKMIHRTGNWPSCRSPCIRTCCATPAASSSPTMASSAEPAISTTTSAGRPAAAQRSRITNGSALFKAFTLRPSRLSTMSQKST